MTDRPPVNFKAAIKIDQPYVADCLASFESGEMYVNYDRLIREAEPVNFFNDAIKTDYLVLRISCVFVDDLDIDRQPKPNPTVAIIRRSKEDHDQNEDVNSILISSELVGTYTFLKTSSGQIINRHHPFTEKMGAYLGAFGIERKPWIRRLRRQIDKQTGQMRHYAFYVHKAHLDPSEGHNLPTHFSLMGNVKHDEFLGFWSYKDALKKVHSDDLLIDKLVLKNLCGEEFTHNDINASIGETSVSSYGSPLK